MKTKCKRGQVTRCVSKDEWTLETSVGHTRSGHPVVNHALMKGAKQVNEYSGHEDALEALLERTGSKQNIFPPTRAMAGLGLRGSPEQHEVAVERAVNGVYEYTKAVRAYEAHGDCSKAVQYGFNLSRNVGIYENEVKWEGSRPDSALVIAAENALTAVTRKCAPRNLVGFQGLGQLTGHTYEGRSPADIRLEQARVYASMARATRKYAEDLRRAGNHIAADAELKIAARLDRSAEAELNDALREEAGEPVDNVRGNKRAYSAGRHDLDGLGLPAEEHAARAEREARDGTDAFLASAATKLRDGECSGAYYDVLGANRTFSRAESDRFAAGLRRDMDGAERVSEMSRRFEAKCLIKKR